MSQTSTAIAKPDSDAPRMTFFQWLLSFFRGARPREGSRYSPAWRDKQRISTSVKRTKRDGASVTIMTDDGFDLTFPTADLAVSSGDVLTIWGRPPDDIRGVAVGSTVLFWYSEADYQRQLDDELQDHLKSLKDGFGTEEMQEMIWTAARSMVHPALLLRMEHLAESTDDFRWRHLFRELFVSVDATNLSKVFKLRGDYYTLRSSPTWKGLRQSAEWALMDQKISAKELHGREGISPYHTRATLDMTLTLAERLAKGEIDGIRDVPAVVDDEPPRILEKHREAPPFPVYLTAAAPPMRIDEDPAPGPVIH